MKRENFINMKDEDIQKQLFYLTRLYFPVNDDTREYLLNIIQNPHNQNEAQLLQLVGRFTNVWIESWPLTPPMITALQHKIDNPSKNTRKKASASARGAIPKKHSSHSSSHGSSSGSSSSNRTYREMSELANKCQRLRLIDGVNRNANALSLDIFSSLLVNHFIEGKFKICGGGGFNIGTMILLNFIISLIYSCNENEFSKIKNMAVSFLERASLTKDQIKDLFNYIQMSTGRDFELHCYGGMSAVKNPLPALRHIEFKLSKGNFYLIHNNEEMERISKRIGYDTDELIPKLFDRSELSVEKGFLKFGCAQFSTIKWGYTFKFDWHPFKDFDKTYTRTPYLKNTEFDIALQKGNFDGDSVYKLPLKDDIGSIIIYPLTKDINTSMSKIITFCSKNFNEFLNSMIDITSNTIFMPYLEKSEIDFLNVENALEKVYSCQDTFSANNLPSKKINVYGRFHIESVVHENPYYRRGEKNKLMPDTLNPIYIDTPFFYVLMNEEKYITDVGIYTYSKSS